MTFNNMGIPETTCHANKPTPPTFDTMCTFLAVSLPFCIKGTQLAASAHKTTKPAPAYKCGPGNNFPARAYVFNGPSIAKAVPSNANKAPCEKCLSFTPLEL